MRHTQPSSRQGTLPVSRKLVVVSLLVAALAAELLGGLLDPRTLALVGPGTVISAEPNAVTAGIAAVGIAAMLATAALAPVRPWLRLAVGAVGLGNLDGIVLVPLSEVAWHPTLLVVATASTVSVPLLARVGLELSRGPDEELRRSWVTSWRLTGSLAVAQVAVLMLLVLLRWLESLLEMLVLIASSVLALPILLATAQAVVSGIRSLQILRGHRPLSLRPAVFGTLLAVSLLLVVPLVLPWVLMWVLMSLE